MTDKQFTPVNFSPGERKRLEALADHLEGPMILPFNMKWWLALSEVDNLRYGDDEVKYFSDVISGRHVPSCPTAACALGHCPLIEGMEITDADMLAGGEKINWLGYGHRLFPSLFTESGAFTAPGAYIFDDWMEFSPKGKEVAYAIRTVLLQGMPTDDEEPSFWDHYNHASLAL